MVREPKPKPETVAPLAPLALAPAAGAVQDNAAQAAQDSAPAIFADGAQVAPIEYNALTLSAAASVAMIDAPAAPGHELGKKAAQAAAKAESRAEAEKAARAVLAQHFAQKAAEARAARLAASAQDDRENKRERSHPGEMAPEAPKAPGPILPKNSEAESLLLSAMPWRDQTLPKDERRRLSAEARQKAQNDFLCAIGARSLWPKQYGPTVKA